MIHIVDYGLGNPASIANMLKRLGLASILTSSADELTHADRIVLPGVGAFDACMNNLKKFGLVEFLNHKVMKEGVPILGVCLGMQLLCTGSEEGMSAGLGFIDAKFARFVPVQGGIKRLHMGWSDVKF